MRIADAYKNVVADERAEKAKAEAAKKEKEREEKAQKDADDKYKAEKADKAALEEAKGKITEATNGIVEDATEIKKEAEENEKDAVQAGGGAEELKAIEDYVNAIEVKLVSIEAENLKVLKPKVPSDVVRSIKQLRKDMAKLKGLVTGGPAPVALSPQEVSSTGDKSPTAIKEEEVVAKKDGGPVPENIVQPSKRKGPNGEDIVPEENDEQPPVPQPIVPQPPVPPGGDNEELKNLKIKI